MRQKLGKGACNQAAALLHHRSRPSPGVLQFCCVAPLNNFSYIRINRTARARPTFRQRLCCTVCKCVKSGSQKSAVTQVVLAPHKRGSPAELHSARAFEAGDTLPVITDGFETYQPSAHAQPTAIYAERDAGIKLHRSASVTVLLQWPLLDVMAKLIPSCGSANMQHQSNHDISVISSVNQGTVYGRIDRRRNHISSSEARRRFRGDGRGHIPN